MGVPKRVEMDSLKAIPTESGFVPGVGVNAGQKLVATDEAPVLAGTDYPADQSFQPIAVKTRKFVGVTGGTTSPVFLSSSFLKTHHSPSGISSP